VQVIDLIETYREMLSGMLDIYLSSVSNRMNDIMRVLTIVGTIFIPLTFIVGVYGMNFKHMPELEWQNGYFGVWGIMIALTVAMLAAFKWRKWI
jgi:magnesium transporter